ncbi:MAG: hypothetical protein U0572_01160 [Phycisphaerales bacterium]
MIAPRYAIALGLAAALLAVAIGARSLESRRAALAERESLAADAARDVATVLELRGKRERASLRERPRQDLIARVRTVMRETSLAEAAFAGIQSEGDAPAGEGAAGEAAGFRAQSMRLSLHGVALAELGRFLARWRESQPLWTPTSIELLPVAARPGRQSKEEDAAVERFDSTIVLASVYVAPARREPSAGGSR